MATGMPPPIVQVPRLEDEIEQAWQQWQTIDEANMRDAFEAGFRAARTVHLGDVPWQA